MGNKAGAVWLLWLALVHAVVARRARLQHSDSHNSAVLDVVAVQPQVRTVSLQQSLSFNHSAHEQQTIDFETGAEQPAVGINTALGLLKLAADDGLMNAQILDLEQMGRLQSTPTESDIANTLFAAALSSAEIEPAKAEADAFVPQCSTEADPCVVTEIGHIFGFSTISFDFYINSASCETPTTLVELLKNPSAALTNAQVLPKDIRRAQAYGTKADCLVFGLKLQKNTDSQCEIAYTVDAVGSPRIHQVLEEADFRHQILAPILTDSASLRETFSPEEELWTRIQVVHQGTDVQVFANGQLISQVGDFAVLEYFGANELKVSSKANSLKIFPSARIPRLADDSKPIPGFEDSLQFCGAQFEPYHEQFVQMPTKSFATKSPVQKLSIDPQALKKDTKGKTFLKRAVLLCCLDPTCRGFSVQETKASEKFEYSAHLDLGPTPHKTALSHSPQAWMFKKRDPKHELPSNVNQGGQFRRSAWEKRLSTLRMSSSTFMNLAEIMHVSRFPPTELIAHSIDKFVDLAGGVPAPYISADQFVDAIVASVKRCVDAEDVAAQARNQQYEKLLTEMKTSVVTRIYDFNGHWNFPPCLESTAVSDSSPCSHTVDGVLEVGAHAPIAVCDFVRNELLERKLVSPASVAAARSAMRGYVTAWREQHSSEVGKSRGWVDLPRLWVAKQIAEVLLPARLATTSSDETARHVLLDAVLDIFDFDVLMGFDSSKPHFSECEWSLLYSFVLYEKRPAAKADMDLFSLFSLLEVVEQLSAEQALTPQTLSLESFRYMIKIINVGLSILAEGCSSPDPVTGKCPPGQGSTVFSIDHLTFARGGPAKDGTYKFAENIFRSLACSTDREKPLDEIKIDRQHLLRYFARLITGPDDAANHRIDRMLHDFGPHDLDGQGLVTWQKFRHAFYNPAELFRGITDDEIVQAKSVLLAVSRAKQGLEPDPKREEPNMLSQTGNAFSAFMTSALSFRNALCDWSDATCVAGEKSRKAKVCPEGTDCRSIAKELPGINFPSSWATALGTFKAAHTKGVVFTEWVRFFSTQTVDEAFQVSLAGVPRVVKIVVNGYDSPTTPLQIYVKATDEIADLVATSFQLQTAGNTVSLVDKVNRLHGSESEPTGRPFQDQLAETNVRAYIKPCQPTKVAIMSMPTPNLNLCEPKDQAGECSTHDLVCQPLATTDPAKSTDWLVSLPVDPQQMAGALHFRFDFLVCKDGACASGSPFDDKDPKVHREYGRNKHHGNKIQLSPYPLPVQTGVPTIRRMFSVRINVVSASTPYPPPSVTKHNFAFGCVGTTKDGCTDPEVPDPITKDFLLGTTFTKCPEIETVQAQINPFAASRCEVLVDMSSFVTNFADGWNGLKALSGIRVEAFVTLVAHVTAPELPDGVNNFEHVWHTKATDADGKRKQQPTVLESSNSRTWDACVSRKIPVGDSEAHRGAKQSTQKCKPSSASEAFMHESMFGEFSEFSALTFNVRMTAADAFAPTDDATGLYFVEMKRLDEAGAGVSTAAMPFHVKVKLPDFAKLT